MRFGSFRCLAFGHRHEGDPRVSKIRCTRSADLFFDPIRRGEARRGEVRKTVSEHAKGRTSLKRSDTERAKSLSRRDRGGESSKRGK